MKDTRKTIDDALGFLAAVQLKDGGFKSFSSPIKTPWKPAYTYRTILVPALILSALKNIEHPTAASIRKRLAHFLLQQKSPSWSFNYWARNSQEAYTFRYPDDLDDTFCALYALYHYDRAIIDGHVLAKMAQLLIATESAPGGPYRTWLIDRQAKKHWQDVDVAVNSNVAAFLAIAVEPLPTLTCFLEETLQKDQALSSPYYPDAFPLLYYLTRISHGIDKTLIGKQLQRQSANTPLNTALIMACQHNLGIQPLAQHVKFLLETQSADGSWPAEAFCYDPHRNKQTFYHGAPALTTAFAIEALASQTTTPKHQLPTTKQHHHSPLFMKVIIQAKHELSRLDENLRPKALATLDRTTKSRNSQEIILLAQQFTATLKSDTKPHPAQLALLGLANLYGWMSYTLYDDFFDGQSLPQRLGVANAIMRRSLQTFMRVLPHNQHFQNQILDRFDTMDAANTWESTYCRWQVEDGRLRIAHCPHFETLDQLAQKSLGHTLTPLAILTMTNASPETIWHIDTALRHYIIAKQLHDDMHDWKEDIAAGRITFVVSSILAQLQLPLGYHRLETLMPKAEKTFWHRSLPELCNNITQHITLSRSSLAASSIMEPHNVISKLLDRIEATNQETLTTLAQVETFLQTYQNKDI